MEARTGLAFLLAAAAAGGCSRSGGRDGPGGLTTGPAPYVLSVYPTNGQVVEPDLSDPGLNGAVLIRFGERPRLRDLLDSDNTVNGLSKNVQLAGPDFTRVPGISTFDEASLTLRIAPTGDLVPGPYEIRLSREIAMGRKTRLNLGLEDFTTAFTVGPDTYPPRLRDSSPVANQSDVDPFAGILLTFNESLDPATVLLGETVLVEDAGRAAPRPIPGTLLLRRDGFDLEFRPDPAEGLPAGTEVRLTVTSGIADRRGNHPEESTVLGFFTRGGGATPGGGAPPVLPPAVLALTDRGTYLLDGREALAAEESVRPELVRMRRIDAPGSPIREGAPSAGPATGPFLRIDRRGGRVEMVDGVDHSGIRPSAAIAAWEVGPGLLDAALDPTGRLGFAAREDGRIAVWDATVTTAPPVLLELPGVRSVLRLSDR